jgi:hypothetical protein
MVEFWGLNCWFRLLVRKSRKWHTSVSVAWGIDAIIAVEQKQLISYRTHTHTHMHIHKHKSVSVSWRYETYE